MAVGRVGDGALQDLGGSGRGECHRRHRAVEFRSFLKTIDKEVPDELQVHLITLSGNLDETDDEFSLSWAN